MVKLASSWRNFQDHRSSGKDLKNEMSHMRARIADLENEIKAWDESIAARDWEIEVGQKQREALEAQALEFEVTLDWVFCELTKANKNKGLQEVELSASRTERATLSADLTLAKVEKEEAVAEKDQAVAEKATVAELQKGSKDRYQKLRKKHHHYKSKAKRLLKQLSFMPWLGPGF
jgi:chromosome segregation ATPase